MNVFPANRRLRLFFITGLFLAFGGLIFAGFWLFTSSGGTSYFSAPAPTHDYIWSYFEIAKPSKMSAPGFPAPGTAADGSTSIIGESVPLIPAGTLVPVPAAAETPGEMVMEIVENTPVPVHAAPQLPSYSGSKYILVDISEQHMYVYDGDALVYSFVASTGINNATRVGTFAVQSKIPNAYGATWNIWMPNWLGIYWSGSLENGIHALPILPNGATLWEGYLGRPVSYGCVVLGTFESGLLYDWAEIGTPVEIQW